MAAPGSRSFNTEDDSYLVGKVVDTNDPEKKGRVKVRGLNEDEANITDEQLPWMYVQNQGYSQHGGVGRMPHQYVQGQWLSYRRSSSDSQTSMVIGPINSDKKNEGSGGEEDRHFVPPHAKGKRYVLKSTKPGDGTLNTEPVKVEWDKENDPRKFFLDKANKIQAKFKEMKSIGPFDSDGGGFGGSGLGGGGSGGGGTGESAGGGTGGGGGKGSGADIIGFIKKHDPKNSSGAFKGALDIMKNILGNQNPLASAMEAMGADNLSSFNSFVDDEIKQQQEKTEDEGGVCIDQDGKYGHLKKINNELVCVIDEPVAGDRCKLPSGQDGVWRTINNTLRCVIR